MKKVLFSLLMAFVCLPMAIGQTKDAPVVQTIDTTVCGSLTWEGNIYTSDTVLFFLHGDSALVIRLTIDTGSISTNNTVAACDQYTAPWGEILTVSGNYNVDTTINGCVQHHVLNLTINNNVTAATEYVTAECAYTWNGLTITDTELHFDTLNTAAGCDSVISLQVTSFTHQVVINDTVAACGSFVSAWNETYTASGDYSDTATNDGCTTVRNLNLTINGIYTDTADVVVENVTGGCNYVWHGQTFTDTNETHYTTVQTVAGCDSIIAINITGYTNHNYDTTYVEQCGNRYPASYTATWYGRVFENPDTNFTNTPSNPVLEGDTVTVEANGCTVHHHLHLTFVHDYDTIALRGCDEVRYTFASRLGRSGVRDTAFFTTSGEYDQDTNGVDLYSRHFNTRCITHHHLDVTVVEPEQHVRLDTIVANKCDSYTFKFRNYQITVTSDTAFEYTYQYHDINNDLCFDSVMNVDITIRHSSHRDTVVVACDTFTWNFNGKLYNVSGVYKQTIDDTTNSQGCDSIGQLTLTVNKTPVVSIEGNWILQPGETANLSANCIESNVDFKWYTGTSTTPASTTATLSVTPENGENVDVHLVTTKSYAGNHSCAANNWITVTSNVGIDDVESMMVNIYPNPTSRVINVQSTDGVSEVVIYNAIGQQVLRQNGNGDRMQLDLGNLASGNYTVRITGATGEQVTRKINVSK